MADAPPLDSRMTDALGKARVLSEALPWITKIGFLARLWWAGRF
jgi:hypothetical protein